MSPVLCRHGTVERCESGVRKVRQQAGEVAVSDEDLGVSLDLAEIDSVEQVIGAIAAARTKNGVNIIAVEHLFQFADAAIDRSREIEIAVENRIEIEGLVSRTLRASHPAARSACLILLA